MNRLKNRFFRGVGYWVSIIAILFFANGVALADLQEIIKRGELRVALYNQGPPFSFYNKNNEFVGSSSEANAKKMFPNAELKSFKGAAGC